MLLMKILADITNKIDFFVFLRDDNTGSRWLNHFSGICLIRREISFSIVEGGTMAVLAWFSAAALPQLIHRASLQKSCFCSVLDIHSDLSDPLASSSNIIAAIE